MYDQLARHYVLKRAHPSYTRNLINLQRARARGL